MRKSRPLVIFIGNCLASQDARNVRFLVQPNVPPNADTCRSYGDTDMAPLSWPDHTLGHAVLSAIESSLTLGSNRCRWSTLYSAWSPTGQGCGNKCALTAKAGTVQRQGLRFPLLCAGVRAPSYPDMRYRDHGIAMEERKVQS